MTEHSSHQLDFRGVSPEAARLQFILDCMELAQGESLLCVFDEDPSDLLREVERLSVSRHFRRIDRGRWIIHH